MEKINKIAQSEASQSTTRLGIYELEIEKIYKITNARFVHTRYGKTLLLEMDDFITFLPKRFNILTNSEVEDMAGSHLKLVKERGTQSLNIVFMK